MSKEQIVSNTEKVNNGINLETNIYSKLKSLTNIENLETQKRFYKKEKTDEEEIFERLKLKKIKEFENEKIKEEIEEFFKKYKDKPIRNNREFYKSADITFLTKQEYLLKGKKSKIRIIIDTTTSARSDRIKGKAQDCSVYNSFDMNYIYFIVFPNDNYFSKYDNPKREIKNCKTTIYNHNFKNLYKEENVSLILQEDDLINFLEYIKDTETEDIEDLIYEWKHNYYKDFSLQSKKENNTYKDGLLLKVLNLYK